MAIGALDARLRKLEASTGDVEPFEIIRIIVAPGPNGPVDTGTRYIQRTDEPGGTLIGRELLDQPDDQGNANAGA